MKIITMLFFYFFCLALLIGFWVVINGVITRFTRFKSKAEVCTESRCTTKSEDWWGYLNERMDDEGATKPIDTIKSLRKLQKIYKSGELTQSEYEELKKQILEAVLVKKTKAVYARTAKLLG